MTSIEEMRQQMKAHDERVRDDVFSRIMKKAEAKMCHTQCNDSGVGDKDCLECEGTMLSIIDLAEIIAEIKEELK